MSGYTKCGRRRYSKLTEAAAPFARSYAIATLDTNLVEALSNRVHSQGCTSDLLNKYRQIRSAFFGNRAHRRVSNGCELKLQKLIVENYRGFKRLELDFESDCTILIGENNAGKTNVLDAVYASLRANRSVRQGAFGTEDYHLGSPQALAGEAGPIVLTITFAEREANEWNIDLVSALEDVVAFDKHGKRSITLQVKGTAPGKADAEYEWAFLDAEGKSKGENKHIGQLNQLQRVRPLYTLDTLRDAAKEFSQRSTFFGPFVSDPKFDDDVRDSLLKALGEINEKVLSEHAVFNVLKKNLDAGHHIVQAVNQDAAKIEAVPSRLSDLLANTQVSFQSRSGVPLPLGRHGSGTQSLSVFSLFRAYVEAKLLTKVEPLSEPILTIEEPETHLHPAAARAMWSVLSALPGQAIVTSHSGDLVGEAPLRCIRRISARDGSIASSKVDRSAFTDKEMHNLDFYVRLSRGELLFANAWLLVEGKSEIILLQGISRAAGIDLYSNGVRVIEHSSYGKTKPFIKLADQLGIHWHCLCDNDDAGQRYAKETRELIGKRAENEYLTVLDTGKLEAYLCRHGFEAEYRNAVPEQGAAQITETPGTDAYYVQLAELVPDTEKITTVMKICERISADPSCLPPLLRTVIDRCVAGPQP